MNDCVPGRSQEIDLSDLLAALGEAVEGTLISDPEAMTAYTSDWSGRWKGQAVAVVLPSTTEQVARVVRVCGELGFAVLPQGGNTGLVGGGVPAADATRTVILSTSKLKGLGEIDPVSGQFEAAAGETVAAVQHHALKAGWYYGVDLASRDSATIGGNVATNAGGIRVCAFGMTRSQVVGIEAVLADGTVTRSMRGLVRDNTGYDLSDLFCGSEGTLGVITSVLLKAHKPVGQTELVLVGLNSLSEGIAYARAIKHSTLLTAAEVMDRNGLETVCKVVDLPWPLELDNWKYVALYEFETKLDDTQLDWIPEDADAVVAQSVADIERMWLYRERQSEAAQTLANRGLGEQLVKLDISLPVGVLDAFESALRNLIPATKLIVMGHFYDGNLHLEIATDENETEEVTKIALALVASFDGSISAEHGIGQAKAHYLNLSRSEGELSVMRAIKKSLDPQGILAPGVIFGA